MSSEGRQFAYGDNCVDGIGCPATQAGYNPDELDEDPPWTARIADQYDLYVAFEMFERDGGNVEDLDVAAIHPDLRERGYGEGHVDEATARECWLEAMEVQDHQHQGDTVERAGTRVAEALGWIEEDQER